MKVKVSRLSEDEAEQRGILDWPVWEKGVSEFEWSYDQGEEFYVIEGEAEVEAEGEKVKFGRGDLVEMPAGWECKWRVIKPIKKHYRMI